MTKQKRLAIIGAGEAALPYIETAKKNNIICICFGREQDSLYKDQCDEFVNVSIFDIEKVAAACRKKNIDGIVASSEVATPVAAEVAYLLGLPGNRIEGGFAGRDKYLMRRLVAEKTNISQPVFSLFEEGEDYSYPLVVKALDSCGKRGITLVESKEQLMDAVSYARKFSSTGDVLVEEYLAGGKEYSVECLVGSGLCEVIQVTEKESSGPPHFVELAHHQPAFLREEEKKKICQCAKEILNAVGLTSCPAHLEVKVIDGEVFFIEVGARHGGDRIADTLLGLSTEYDYFSEAIRIALGERTFSESHTVACSGTIYLCSQSRRMHPLFHVAPTASWCKEYDYHPEKIGEATGNSDRNGGYIIYKADHRITIEDAVVRLNDYENGFDLLYRHNLEIGRDMPDDELRAGLKRFLDIGNVFALVVDNRIVAMLNLYCNNLETLNGYINNVFVVPEYRGYGYSSVLVKRAIKYCCERHFKTITLHVAEDNMPAVKAYRHQGFVFTDNYHGSTREMKLELNSCLVRV